MRPPPGSREWAVTPEAPSAGPARKQWQAVHGGTPNTVAPTDADWLSTLDRLPGNSPSTASQVREGRVRYCAMGRRRACCPQLIIRAELHWTVSLPPSDSLAHALPAMLAGVLCTRVVGHPLATCADPSLCGVQPIRAAPSSMGTTLISQLLSGMPRRRAALPVTRPARGVTISSAVRSPPREPQHRVAARRSLTGARRAG